LREAELRALGRAERLVAESRAIASDLKGRVDALVLSANENIVRAATAMGDTIVDQHGLVHRRQRRGGLASDPASPTVSWCATSA
jgi:hypothetical protein